MKTTLAFHGHSIVDNLRNRIQWHRKKRTLDALLGLDDHMLRDIGLTRGEVAALMRQRRMPTR